MVQKGSRHVSRNKFLGQNFLNTFLAQDNFHEIFHYFLSRHIFTLNTSKWRKKVPGMFQETDLWDKVANWVYPKYAKAGHPALLLGQLNYLMCFYMDFHVEVIFRLNVLMNLTLCIRVLQLVCDNMY